MATFPAEILLGIYLGLLVGVLPGLVSWVAGFSFRYLTGTRLAGAGVMALAAALAGTNGVLLARTDQAILTDPSALRVGTAILVVGTLSLYAHSSGDRTAAEFPRRLSLSQLREQTLSAQHAEFVNDGQEVRIRVAGEVSDMEGYPPLPEELRARLRNAQLRLPADLRLGELEERVEDRLRTEYDLGDVSVTVDERGRATVVAAPPFSGLSKRVDHDRHAVSISGLIPTGLAYGDEVTVITPNAQVRGIVVSAEAGGETERPEIEPLSNDEPVGGDSAATPVRTPTTDGGEGQITVAVKRTDVQPLLAADEAKVVVEPRGSRREYELISMLRRADNRVRRLAVTPDSPLADTRLGSTDLQARHGVSVLAVRKGEGWLIAPGGQTTLEPGDDVFAAGRREDLDAFETRGPGSGGVVP